MATTSEADEVMSQDGNHRSTGIAKVSPDSIQLGGHVTSVDLSWMSDEQRSAILGDYTRGMLDIERKARELHVNVAALKATLTTLAETTKEVAEAGNAATISHTQSTPIGRTEIIMGNTTQAQTGKLTKSQRGERDWTPYYVFGGLVTVVIVAALVLGR